MYMQYMFYEMPMFSYRYGRVAPGRVHARRSGRRGRKQPKDNSIRMRTGRGLQADLGSSQGTGALISAPSLFQMGRSGRRSAENFDSLPHSHTSSSNLIFCSRPPTPFLLLAVTKNALNHHGCGSWVKDPVSVYKPVVYHSG